MSCKILISNSDDPGMNGSPVCVMHGNQVLGAMESRQRFDEMGRDPEQWVPSFLIVNVTDSDHNEMQWCTEHHDVYRYKVDIENVTAVNGIDLISSNELSMTSQQFEGLLSERYTDATDVYYQK